MRNVVSTVQRQVHVCTMYALYMQLYQIGSKKLLEYYCSEFLENCLPNLWNERRNFWIKTKFPKQFIKS